MRPKANKCALSQLFLTNVLLLHLLSSPIAALRCRTDDGPSEAELKRIARSCMRKITENNTSNHGTNGYNNSGNNNNNNGGSTGSSSSWNNAYGGGSYGNNNNNNYYGQQRGQQESHFGGGYAGQYDNMDYDYGGNEDGSNSNNYNNNYFGRFGHGEQDILRQRNRERQQASGRSVGLTQTRYDYESNGSSSGSNAGSSGGRNSNNNSGSNSNSNSGSNRNSNRRSNNNHNNNNNNNSSNYDAACVVHCFFEELHVLNNEEYPDRYKVQHLLVRELRDRELRNFYAETIQQCFHYMESQRRRDKCHYSRDLINCMSELVKANCDDWQEYSVIFN